MKSKQRWLSRNFALLLLGQVSSLIGNFTLKFALSMYVLDQTGSAALFATLLAVSMVPTVLLSPFGGILADRVNRRDLMVALDFLSGVTVLAAGLLLPLGHSIGVIAVLLVTLSVLAAFESPTVQACIPQMLPTEHLVKGNAAVSQIQAITSLFTPFLGSAAYAAFGLRPVLWGAVACFFVTAALECLIRLEYRRPAGAQSIRQVIREDLTVSVRFLRRDRPEILRLLLLAALVSLFVAGTAVVGFPYLVRTVLGLPVGYYGVAESAMGVAAILGSLFVALAAAKLGLRRLAVVIVGFGLCLLPAGFAFLFPVGTIGRYAVLLGMFCICQFLCSVFSTWSITVIQARTPEHLMGKVMSFVFTLSMCAQPVGQIVYGALFDRFSHGPQWVLLPSGILVLLIGLATVPFFRTLEKSVPAQAPTENSRPEGG
ncbi:MAG: MFS transporter [Subdoligranulum variabile]|nr:MAG: MFS transporter [Subdoligranulum variabile]